MPSTKPIPQMIVKAGNTAKKFLETLEEKSLDVQYGKKVLAAAQIENVENYNDPKNRARILNDISFFKDPSINAFTVLLKTLNGYELCDPFSFALTQAFPAGSPIGGKVAQVQGIIQSLFEKFQNFTIIPGNVEIDLVSVAPDPLSDEEFGGFTFETNQGTQVLNVFGENPLMPDGTVFYLYQTEDPKVTSFLTCRIVSSFATDEEGFDPTARSYVMEIESRSTIDPPFELLPNGKPVLNANNEPTPRIFSDFKIEFEKKTTTNVRELSEELQGIANALNEIGYEDLLDDINSIPSAFPGIAKLKEAANKIGSVLALFGNTTSSAGQEVGVAAGTLAGGLTTRQVIESSKVVQEFIRKIEPILNFQNILTNAYKNTVENLNKILRDAIPYEELSKFVKFIVRFAQVIEGVVTFLITLLKTLSGIIKTITVILKVFKVVIKVIKLAIAILPAMFTTVGVNQIFIDKLDQAEEALGGAIKFLENISKFLDRIRGRFESLRRSIQEMIKEGTALAAKLDSCEAMKGNGMGSSMENFVKQLNNTLHTLTQSLPGDDFYPGDPNRPGSGVNTQDLPDGVRSVVRTADGEILFVKDSMIGFDADGNLIFFGELTSLSTGVAFNDTLGQRFRNENLRFYTFDKFRNKQRGLLTIADDIAFQRQTRIQEVDPTDRFGNFAEKFLGYTIKIQEEDISGINTQLSTRRRGIALDSNEKIVVSTELTFSDDLPGIVNEVKFLIKRDIEEGILGVNTPDGQPNEIADTEAINLAKTVGANPIAISNIEAENNNKLSVKPVPPTENPTRIGNRPFTKDDNKPSQRKTDKNSTGKSIDTKGIAREGISKFIAETPSLSNLAANLSTINSATPSQLGNILKTPGIENLSEEELVQKLKGEILSSMDPNPDKIEEVKEKTRKWYGGLRGKARAEFDRIKLSASMPSAGGKPGVAGAAGGKKLFPTGDAFEFEPFITKIELKEIPKWIKLLLRSGYTQNEIDAGLQDEGVRDKYDIKVDDKGRVDIRKKLAFQESNFKKGRRK